MSEAHQFTERSSPLSARPREYETAAVQWLTTTVRELGRVIHPLLDQFSRIEVREEPSAGQEQPPPQASPLYRQIEMSHRWDVSIEDIVNNNLDQFVSDLYDMADDFGSQIIQGMLEHISEVLEETENVIDATGRDFFDAYIDSLETIDMSFDDDGQPQLTMVMHPTQFEALRQRVPTPEQEARLNEVIERRRQEWHASRRRRELPGHTQ